MLTNCDFAPVRDYANLIANEYIHDVPKLVPQTVRDADAHTQAALTAIESLTRKTLDERVMYPDAVEPLGLDEIFAFLRGASDFRFAARASVPHGGITMHGHRLVEFETLSMTLDKRTQFVTFYLDESGKIAYLEATN